MKRYIWKKNPKVPTIVVVGAGFAGINFVKAVRCLFNQSLNAHQMTGEGGFTERVSLYIR